MALVLASASPARASLLSAAGLAFTVAPSALDERSVEATLAAEGADPGRIALRLAEEKARAVSGHQPDAIVVGADQTLSIGGERFHKPGSREAAGRQIRALSGRTHCLHAAVACARDGGVVFHHLAVARLTLRALTDAEIARYLDRAGEAVQNSVGAYQVEGLGIRLFERIEGDHSTILGLPLLPLLAFLRACGEIDL
jgi:septum formation protein